MTTTAATRSRAAEAKQARRAKAQAALAQCLEETRVEYARLPEAEDAIVAAWSDKYRRYCAARTLGESLLLGSKPADWCRDHDRGLLKLLGPLRAVTYALMHGILAASLGTLWRWQAPWP